MPGYTYNTVLERFGLSTEYAESSFAATETYIDNLQALLASFVVPSATALNAITLPEVLPIDFSTVPTFDTVLSEFPSFTHHFIPNAPNLNGIPIIGTSSIPERQFDFVPGNLVAPTLSFGTAPTEPALNTINIPGKPSYTLPTAPVLPELTLPSPPSISIPEFDAVEPSLELPDSPTSFTYIEAPYNSDIAVVLFAKILNDLANGGTGLDVVTEAELYARGQERQRVENEALYTQVIGQYSSSGFNFPSGIIAAKIAEVLAEISRKTDQINREITINQAELAQKNTHFTIEQAVVLEKMLRDFFNQVADRALEAAKSIALAGIEVFKALVDRQKLKFDIYGVLAEVFKSRIDATRLSVEIYKTQMEAVKVAVDVQEARVRIYQTQVAVTELLIKLYATEMESAKIQAEIESLKVSLFKAQTEAYISRISAEKVKVDIYATSVEADKTRAMAFGETVRAYQIEVEAKKAIVEARIASADLLLRDNAMMIEEYKAKLQAYQLEIDSEIKVAQLEVEAFKTDAMIYDARVKAKSLEYDTKVKEIDISLRRATLEVEREKAELDASVNAYIALKSLQEKGTEGIMNVAAQLAASALNAVNASASIAASDSNSESNATSESESVNYNYNYDA